MGDDVFHNPLAQARVAELLKLPKNNLVMLAQAPTVRSHTSVATLARWRKQELAWTIAAAEFTPGNHPA